MIAWGSFGLGIMAGFILFVVMAIVLAMTRLSDEREKEGPAYMNKKYTSQTSFVKIKSKDRKLRTCLKCDEEFDSRGKENRICPKCKYWYENGSWGNGISYPNLEL